ncbi:MAG: hypothetical protein H7066_07625, partial [Cytophagaceae bacterium]|nr:hypothetical protein [Gemmatimonadaceae bacterium]
MTWRLRTRKGGKMSPGTHSVEHLAFPRAPMPWPRYLRSLTRTLPGRSMITYDPKNWLRILFDFPRSPVFRTLALDVLGAGAYAALVVWGENTLGMAVPLGPSFLSILGIILGLLLVFRTNTAYDRWWEGRRAWGQLVNTSRAIGHALDAMLPDRAPERARYATLLSAYPAVLAAYLRTPRGTG